MTANTGVAPARPAASGSGLSFAGIIRSEWIKLRSLRSTVWCYAIIVVITVGMGVLLASTFSSGGFGTAGGVQLAVQVATISLSLSVLVASVLGALVITGEYGTGMIRSTFTAVPRRIPALLAKAIVFGLSTFVVGLVSLLATAAATLPILAANGVDVEIGAEFLLPLVGGAGYLALMGVMSLAIGAIIRSSAGGIASSLGLILVVPTIVGIFGLITQTPWLIDAANYLPSNAGSFMYSVPVGGGVDPLTGATTLDPAIGFLVVAAWVAALLVLSAVLVKRRDS